MRTILFLCTLACGASAHAQCTPEWAAGVFGPAGTFDRVYAITPYNDGSGPAVYVGGEFRIEWHRLLDFDDVNQGDRDLLAMDQIADQGERPGVTTAPIDRHDDPLIIARHRSNRRSWSPRAPARQRRSSRVV